jgi:hypothetical protein
MPGMRPAGQFCLAVVQNQAFQLSRVKAA